MCFTVVCVSVFVFDAVGTGDIVHGTFLSRPLITVFCPRASTQHILMVIMITAMKMTIIAMNMFRPSLIKVTKLWTFSVPSNMMIVVMMAWAVKTFVCPSIKGIVCFLCLYGDSLVLLRKL